MNKGRGEESIKKSGKQEVGGAEGNNLKTGTGVISPFFFILSFSSRFLNHPSLGTSSESTGICFLFFLLSSSNRLKETGKRERLVELEAEEENAHIYQ